MRASGKVWLAGDLKAAAWAGGCHRSDLRMGMRRTWNRWRRVRSRPSGSLVRWSSGAQVQWAKQSPQRWQIRAQAHPLSAACGVQLAPMPHRRIGRFQLPLEPFVDGALGGFLQHAPGRELVPDKAQGAEVGIR